MPRLGLAGLLLVALVGSACGTGSRTREPSAASSPTRTSSATTEPGSSSPTASPSATPTASPRPLRGIDASHHQGQIDWERVRRDGVAFAYLKATEGSSFTDPRFVAHARAARRSGLRVGGYHYFTLCSPGGPQAEHFADVLASAGRPSLPPAIDLELLGNCADPPARESLLEEVRTFVETVEDRTGQRMVVYAYPELETRYRIASALERRQWVRRIGDTPPAGDWWLWQRDDRATVDGISGPVDLNVMAP